MINLPEEAAQEYDPRTTAILTALEDKKTTKAAVAHLYAGLLNLPSAEWGVVNWAIRNRWSQSALKDIKRLAWRKRS